jgi:hypothetical protein
MGFCIPTGSLAMTEASLTHTLPDVVAGL